MAPVPSKPEKFRYVFIPADTDDAIEVREFNQVDLENDSFIQMIKKYFAVTNSETGLDKELLIKQMSDHAKKDITESIDPEMLDRLISNTSVDILSIAVPSVENEFRGVSLYCDDKGRAKNLIVNPRAAGLANACGLIGQTFYGDIFLSRVYDDGEDHWFRMHFDMTDVSSDAEWVKRAAYQASRKLSSGPASLSGLADQFFKRTGGSANQTAILDGSNQAAPVIQGEKGLYKWYQTEDDIEVTIPVSIEGLSIKDMSVNMKPKSLVVRLGDTVAVDGDLFESIDTTESTWTYSKKDRILQITLVKKTCGKMWSDLLKS